MGIIASGTVTWFHPGIPNFKGTWSAIFFMAPAGATDLPSSTLPETVRSIGDRIELCEQPVPNPQKLRNCGILAWTRQKYEATWSAVWNGHRRRRRPGAGWSCANAKMMR